MPHVAARTASRDRDTGRYQSHRPEQTLLYQIVDEYYPAPVGIGVGHADAAQLHLAALGEGAGDQAATFQGDALA